MRTAGFAVVVTFVNRVITKTVKNLNKIVRRDEQICLVCKNICHFRRTKLEILSVKDKIFYLFSYLLGTNWYFPGPFSQFHWLDGPEKIRGKQQVDLLAN